MNKFIQTYNKKLTTAKEVVKLIKSDTDVIVGQCASEPQGCMAEFHTVKDKVKDVKVFSVLTLSPYEFYMNPEMKGHFELCSWFHAEGSRKAIKERTGTVTYVPNMLHSAGKDRFVVRKPHIFFGTCTPPDHNGFVSLSLGITYEKDIIENCEIVVLEVNNQLPRTLGDTQLHVDDVDYFVENHKLPPVLPSPNPDEIALKIGNYIADLVEDGSTIQLGIGAIPNAAALSLRNKKDLGVHTEMFVDSMMELYEMGVITNKLKSIHKGKSICTFAMGTEKMYKWLDNNPSVEFLRGSYVNDPCTVRKNSKMISINTCMMIDFQGQVASEAIGINQYSGTGGQTDTAVGAIEGLDGNGKSIIACRSTAKGGAISTITPMLPQGTAVTLHRSHTDYIVTEFGYARLKGLTLRERTTALISIAHPDFRKQLTKQAQEMGYIY
ncbi:MAG: acetyl-CoA hydrolase/transferase family protein [Flavobacteriaceae bacterium]|nr:acetyl-CoA hydrolase/transferase family protein [Flavobacteriaceae bacterium]